MTKKQILVVIVAMFVMSLFVMAASANVGIGDGNDTVCANIGIGDGSGHVTLPIAVTGAKGVGSVDITLYFDPAVVTVTDVTNGDMDAMFSNLENVEDGVVRIGAYQTDSGGMNGEFVLVNVVFAPISYYESCELGISVTTFKDSTPKGNVMAYTISNGTYTAKRDGNGDDDDGWYDDGDDNGDDGNVTPTVTPTTTPTTTPTASPTKTLPDDDTCDTDDTGMFWIYAGIGIAAILVLLYMITRKRDD